MSEIASVAETPLGFRLAAAGAAASLMLTACSGGHTSAPEHHPSQGIVAVPDETERTWTLDTPAAHDSEGLDVPVIEKHVFTASHKLRSDHSVETIPLLTINIDGKKLTATHRAPGLRRSDVGAIEAALQADDRWLAAANRGGTLDRIQFSIQPKYVDSYDQDGNMYYASARKTKAGNIPSTIHYELPSHVIPQRELETMLHHEATHALDERLSFAAPLQGEIFREQALPINRTTYAALCDTIRTSAADSAGLHGRAAQADMDMLAAKVPAIYPGLAAPLDRVDQAMHDGTLGGLEPERQVVFAEDPVPECTTLDPWQVAMDLYGKTIARPGHALTSLIMRYDPEEGWLRAIRTQPAYAAIRETTYLHGEVAGPTLGHPWDNLEEITASALNIATLYPEELRTKLSNLPTEQRLAIQGLLKLIASDTIRANPHQPQLRHFIKTQIAKVIH